MTARNNGIIDPPIDNLLDRVESKYELVIYASKRARPKDAPYPAGLRKAAEAAAPAA